MRENPDLKDEAGRTILYRPVIIVEQTEDNKQLYRLHLTELDPMANEPIRFGIVLSDLIDHLARAYSDATGRDARDIRQQIVKVMRDEDRFKEKDPARGALSGTTIKPRAQ